MWVVDMWKKVECVLFILAIVVVISKCATENEKKEKYEKSLAREMRRKGCSERGAAPQPPTRVNTTSRLIALRNLMRNETEIKNPEIRAYIITSYDEHMTEYTSEYDKRREYISGFSGSYGDAIVTFNSSALWTDGRYHLQADDQLNCDWLLMREGNQNVPTRAEWLKSQLLPGSRIGVDAKLIPAAVFEGLRAELEGSGLELVKIEVNLIDLIWTDHAKYLNNRTAFILDEKYAGKLWFEKVNLVREKLEAIGANAMVVTALDEIAWLFNIRGRDIPCHPFLRSYAVVSHDDARLYVNLTKLNETNIAQHLNYSESGIRQLSVRIYRYDYIWRDLPDLAQEWSSVLIPSPCGYSQGASEAIKDLIPLEKRYLSPSPIIYLKAIKNPTEIEGMKRAHIRDAVAMCSFFAYLEDRFSQGDVFDELTIANSIDEFRFEQSLSTGNSFRTIVGFGANGAQPHYEPSATTDAVINDNNTIVIDSGGQYYDGTTDVTRTIHLGTPTADHKKAYTRVLMGLIQLSSLIFPSNMKMSVADVMARQPLWQIGSDYMHGTGHGVGAYLGVHESPIQLYYNYIRSDDDLFKPGYFLSNEPGYYRENQFGVRLENVLQVVEKPWLRRSSEQSFYGFEDVTLVPFEPKLIDIGLLNENHKRWLNDYNIRIRILVGAELKRQNRMEGFYWMMKKTVLIPENSSGRIFFSKPVLYVHLVVAISSHLLLFP